MFNNIIGHNKQKEYFEKTINDDNLVNSYIFVGDNGIGKKALAYEIAKVILSTDNLNSMPDFKYITKLDDKKNILIEQVRDQVINNIYEKPVAASKKVYIIDNADLMTEQAQNALLKTFEEPPEYVLIILITSNINGLMDTILSRAVKIRFDKLDVSDIKEYLKYNKQIDISDELIEYSNNSIGKINEVCENLMLYQNIDGYFRKLETATKIEILRDRPFTNENIKEAINYMQFKALKLAITSNPIYTEVIQVLEKSKSRLNSNCNYDIVIDNMIVNISNILK